MRLAFAPIWPRPPTVSRRCSSVRQAARANEILRQTRDRRSTRILCALNARTFAAADAANTAELDEVVVTAQKRVSTVQDTPISIAATSGADLQARGITSFAGLAQATPGVSLKSEGPSQTEIEMRGMTSSGGNSATVGFYLDDTPLSGPASAQNGHVVIDPSLYDLNRIEVLRGPQGSASPRKTPGRLPGSAARNTAISTPFGRSMEPRPPMALTWISAGSRRRRRPTGLTPTHRRRSISMRSSAVRHTNQPLTAGVDLTDRF